MAKCNQLTPLPFKGLIASTRWSRAEAGDMIEIWQMAFVLQQQWQRWWWPCSTSELVSIPEALSFYAASLSCTVDFFKRRRVVATTDWPHYHYSRWKTDCADVWRLIKTTPRYQRSIGLSIYQSQTSIMLVDGNSLCCWRLIFICIPVRCDTQSLLERLSDELSVLFVVSYIEIRKIYSQFRPMRTKS